MVGLLSWAGEEHWRRRLTAYSYKKVRSGAATVLEDAWLTYDDPYSTAHACPAITRLVVAYILDIKQKGLKCQSASSSPVIIPFLQV